MRPVLSEEKINPTIKGNVATYYNETLQEVLTAVNSNEWVIVGMAQNPVVKKAKAYLDSKGIKYKYLEYGSYFSEWRRRLSIKMWSGWPTFPQVFHKGTLIGGNDDLQKYLK